jgi:hypothetical protein
MIPPPTLLLGRTTLAVALLSATLVGCAPPASPRSHASAAALAACRQRADEVYNRQNRAAVYQSDTYATSQRDSPFTGAGINGVTSSGLGGLFQHDQFEDDCLTSSGSTAPNAPQVPVAPAGPPGPPGRGSPPP